MSKVESGDSKNLHRDTGTTPDPTKSRVTPTLGATDASGVSQINGASKTNGEIRPNGSTPVNGHQNDNDPVTQYSHIVISTFSKFLTPLLNSEVRKIESNDVIALDYGNVPPNNGNRQTGAELWEMVRLHGGSQGYYAPRLESNLIRSLGTLFDKFHDLNLPMTSLGPGTADAISNEYFIMKRLGSKAFNAIEISPSLARLAAGTIQEKMHAAGNTVKTRYHIGDFNQPWPAKIANGQPMFATMLGGTLSQYDAHKFFKHFSAMTHENSILFFTADCNQQDPLTAYKGQIFKEFKENIWDVLATVAKDHKFDPGKIEYAPTYNKALERIEHRYLVNDDTSVTLNGQEFPLRQGTLITTGYSRRPTPTSFYTAADDTGSSIEFAQKGHEGHIHGFFLVGNKCKAKERFTRHYHHQPG